MTYKDLIETLKIVSKYDGGLENTCLNMWAEHDAHGISFKSNWALDPKDIRRLAEMGWVLGSHGEFDEDDFDKWEHYDELSDDELVELFKCYNGIFKFE